MPPRARGLSEADQELWANYTRQIAPLRDRTGTAAPRPQGHPPSEPSLPGPLPGDATVEAKQAPSPSQPRMKTAVRASKPRLMASPLAVGVQPGGIDKATWQRFRSGRLVATRTLDLHGMTAQRAYHALVSFIRTAHAEQVRCVEVVTGRGSGETGGVIRREFPLWLNLPEIRPLILGAAHPHSLNPGSVRLVLRRIR